MSEMRPRVIKRTRTTAEGAEEVHYYNPPAKSQRAGDHKNCWTIKKDEAMVFHDTGSISLVSAYLATKCADNGEIYKLEIF